MYSYSDQTLERVIEWVSESSTGATELEAAVAATYLIYKRPPRKRQYIMT